MKIGIITFHCSYNYGSVLQAFALKSYLEQKGHDVTVIDYRSIDFYNYRLFRFDNIKHFIADIIFLKKDISRKKNFETFMSQYLNLSTKKYEGNSAFTDLRNDFASYDALICGSDQIWNLDCTKGPIGPYFLDFAVQKTKKIAYAPSLSHYRFDDKYFSKRTQQTISKYLDSFDALSVRESNTVSTFQNLTKKKISVTVDPTIIFSDLNSYRKIELKPKNPKIIKNKFIFAYTLWPSNYMKKYVERIAKQNNLLIVYCSKKTVAYKSPALNLFGMSPKEWLWLIDNAEFVVSNSFHATVFSILFEKSFITFGKDQSTSRMTELLGKLSLLNHLLPEMSDSFIEPFGADYEKVKSQLEILRSDSELFLLEALRK